MRTALVLLAACAPAPAPAPALSHHAPGEPATSPGAPKWIDRSLFISSTQPASRGSLVLTIGEHTATLVQTAEEAPGTLTLEQAEHETGWKTTATQTETGPAHMVGDALALDLENRTESLYLRCWHRTLRIATAGARRVRTRAPTPDCDDPGGWNPPKLVAVDALVCGQGEGLDDGQLAGLDGSHGDVDETLFRFVAAPGIELVEVSDDCFDSKGLRLAKP